MSRFFCVVDLPSHYKIHLVSTPSAIIRTLPVLFNLNLCDTCLMIFSDCHYTRQTPPGLDSLSPRHQAQQTCMRLKRRWRGSWCLSFSSIRKDYAPVAIFRLGDRLFSEVKNEWKVAINSNQWKWKTAPASNSRQQVTIRTNERWRKQKFNSKARQRMVKRA